MITLTLRAQQLHTMDHTDFSDDDDDEAEMNDWMI